MPTIKQEMGAIDRRRFGWYNSLTDDERKSLSMWVLQRWTTCTSSKVDEINEHYLTLTNDIVNVHFNAMSKHPELQFRLMQISGIGSEQPRTWIKPMKKKKEISRNPKLFEFYEKQFPYFSDDEIEQLISIQDRDDQNELLAEHGLNAKEIKAMLK
jgi:hypothetical protein